MGGTQSTAVVTVKVFVKQHQVFKRRIVGVPIVTAMKCPFPTLILKNKWKN
jgi:hypothetical protein